jgi:hypothetical protein|tara:strand:+ start:453 stop:857 length:405 start_codon:yes stop_codon:yes gene_type:complete
VGWISLLLMKKFLEKLAASFFTLSLVLSIGCSSDKYPTEVSLENAPETIAEAFKDEKNRDIKAMAVQATQLLQSKNYIGAHGILKRLMSMKDLTPEQRDLIAGGLMAVSENLNKAREQGNAQVDQYFKMQSFGK